MVKNQNKSVKTVFAPESAFNVALFHLSILSLAIDSTAFLNLLNFYTKQTFLKKIYGVFK